MDGELEMLRRNLRRIQVINNFVQSGFHSFKLFLRDRNRSPIGQNQMEMYDFLNVIRVHKIVVVAPEKYSE